MDLERDFTPNSPNASSTSVIKYYENRSIFITGVTGFLGKVLLEKLLRSCNGVGNIYVLIRPSRGKSPAERHQKLLESSIFDPLRTATEKTNIFNKIICISGDITSPNLGISPENRQLLSENVSVVFHCAATVKFNESLTSALKMNVEGTKYVLELSKTMKNLSSIVYVSTAYSNTDRHNELIEEKIYPPPSDPKMSYEFFSKFEERKLLDSITPLLLGGKVNTYVYSKHLAESLVELEAIEKNLPISIVRPSIVVPIHRDPVQLEGWVDNINAAGVFFSGVMTGLNYISHGDSDINIDFIPVDYVVNIIILAAWETAISNKKQIENCRVYNACIDQFSPVKTGEICKYSLEAANKTPCSQIIRPPSAKFTISFWATLVLNLFAVGIPCLLMDFTSLLLGQRPKMWKYFKSISYGMKVLSHFTLTQYNFKSDNVKELRSKIPTSEKNVFDLNMEEVDWSSYIPACILGMRRYVMKEKDTTIPAAVNTLRWINCCYNFIGLVIISGMSLLLWTATI